MLNVDRAVVKRDCEGDATTYVVYAVVVPDMHDLAYAVSDRRKTRQS